MIRAVGAVAHAIALVLAIPIAAAIVPLGVTAILFASGEQLLSPAVYKNALAAQRVYERLPRLAAAQLATQIAYRPQEPAAAAEEGTPYAFRTLTAEDWERILAAVLPSTWLQAQTERALDLILADPTPSGPLLISLSELKAQLVDGRGLAAYLTLVRAQPACAEAELGAWRTGPTSLPRCRPPDAVLEALTPALAAELASVVQGLPDELDLRGALGGSAGEAGDGFDIAGARLVARLGTLLPLLPAALMAILVVRSPRGLARWVGIPLLVAAAASLSLSAVLVPVADGQVARALAQAPAYWSGELLAAARDLAHELAALLAARLALLSAIVLVVVSAPMLVVARRASGVPMRAQAAASA